LAAAAITIDGHEPRLLFKSVPAANGKWPGPRTDTRATHNPDNDETPPTQKCERGFEIRTGGDLLSQALAGQVPSALRGLTALFGKGRGVSPSP
jgi:hypothetical protein